MKTKKILHILVLVASICLLFTPQSAATSQSVIKKYISDLECEDYPTMTLTVRAIDGNGNAIPRELNTSDFSIYDNNTLVPDPNILPAETGPKYVIFSLDRGQYSNLSKYQVEIQTVMRAFSRDYFQEGIDKVTIIAHTSSDPYLIVLPDTQSQSIFGTAIDNLDLTPSGDKLSGLPGLKAIRSKIDTNNANRVNTVIIHFGRYIGNVEEAANFGTDMAAANIKIYVFQTEEYNQDNYVAYKELAGNSNGDHVLIPKNDKFLSEYTNILKTIEQNSKVHKIRFSMQEYVQSHTIALAEKGAGLISASDREMCNTPIQNPKVVIDDPLNGGSRQLEPGVISVLIKAHVDWTDKHPRDIKKAELIADGKTVDTKNGPLSSESDIYLQLPIQDLLGSQSEIHVTLLVRVEDAGGLKGESSLTHKYIPPPPPTLAPTPLATEKGTSKPTITPIAILPPLPLCPDGLTFKCIINWIRSNWLFLSIVGVIFVLFILLLSTRRQLAHISAPAREALGKRVVQVRDQVRKTLLGGSSHRQDAIAYLQVLMARSDRIGAKIEIYNNRTTLGRDPSVTDVQLYNPDDKTSVSGLHCTIFYDPGKGKFLITDDNSTNGTYVNNKRLEPNEPSDLNDGDEIIMGDVYRQGAKLKFEIAARHPEQPAEVEPLPIEEDFNVDLEPYTPYSAEPPQEQPPEVREKPKKDFDETVPGYRDDEGFTSQDNDSGQPPSSSPRSQQKKGKDKSWLDKLG